MAEYSEARRLASAWGGGRCPIRPTTPGECLVIPKTHVDHVTDLDDVTAQQIMVVAQHIGRRLRRVFNPLRVGMLVHGFGVPHAHPILVPQQGCTT